ncbi:MAG: M67 family peptidase [Planctomycetota bacterium]|nr:MAG: M67 family peptidase [Planctomycetota bacterium]
MESQVLDARGEIRAAASWSRTRLSNPPCRVALPRYSPAMLTISQTLLDTIYRHGEEAFPAECCGILLGSRDGDRRLVQEVKPAQNLRAEERNDRYEIDPAFRKQVEDEAASRGLAVIGFYHSHPNHEAYFSQTDLECCEEYIWGEPWIPSTYSYPVVSVKEGQAAYHKCFIIVDGEAQEEELVIR